MNGQNDLLKSLVKKMPLFILLVIIVFGQFLALRGIVKLLYLYILKDGTQPPFQWITGNPFEPSYFELASTVVFLIAGFAFSTKVHALDKPFLRIYLGWSMFFGITFQYLWLVSAKVLTGVFPFFIESAELIEIEDPLIREIVIGNMDGIRTILLLIPLVIVLLIVMWIGKQYIPYHEDTIEFLKTWKIRTPKLNVFFEVQEEATEPDVILGPNIKTKELVKQKAHDRPLNNVIIGPIGSGKTSALLLPMINQDLHHMSRYINAFPTLSQREDFHTEEVEGQYLNGITIIEPSNDLCQKAYQLVKAHGIPEESVYYIDPTNPNTKGINPLKGPVDKVAESFVMVVEGIGEKQEFFFQQSQRTHLKNYIYLLKLHDPEREPTFDDLIDMYANPQLVHNMHRKLKAQIPENIDAIEDRDERNHWKIVKNIDEWFDNSLGIVEERKGPLTVKAIVKEGPFINQFQYYDKKEEHVVGLRNILNDISANKLIRRVLFGTSDFDMDAHLARGGVLLVNTAKGELAELSNVLGKFVLLSVQNAVFRRKPNDSPYHSLIVDEFPDYIYEPFKEFPAQSRKYKVIVTIVAQTVAQLSMKYSDDFLQTLLATCRHKFVYGDIAQKDAELFSKIFGEKEKYEESESDQEVSSMYSGATRRTGYTYTKKKEVIMSPQDLIYQPKFVCACKLVIDNEAIPVQQIQANFVPKQEFKKAIITVDEESGEIWLRERELFTEQMLLESHKDLQLQEDDSIVDEIQEDMKQEQKERIIQNVDMYVEETIDDMPRDIHMEEVPNELDLSFSVPFQKPIEDEAAESQKAEQEVIKSPFISDEKEFVNSTPRGSLMDSLETEAIPPSMKPNANTFDDVFGDEVDVELATSSIFGEMEVDPFEKSKSKNDSTGRTYSEGNDDLLNQLKKSINSEK